jgi:hypothetical protein
MQKYCVTYELNIWVDAKNEEEAREKAAILTDGVNIDSNSGLEYPSVEIV